MLIRRRMMRKQFKAIWLIVAGIAIVLAGCGGASNSSYAKSESYDYAAEEAMYDYDSYSDDVYEYAAPEAAKLSENGEATEIEAVSNRKLIKNVSLSVETKEFDTLIQNVNNKISMLGGYAESTNISGNSYDSSYNRNAYIVARIPAKNLDSFISAVEAQSNITNKNENIDDVTLQYADVEAHKNSLKIEQERLNELLAQADSLETIIALEERQAEVRYELESYESRLRLMDNQVEYSTVNIDITEVKEYMPEPSSELSFGERIAVGFAGSCAAAVEAIQDFIIGFVSFIPILGVLIIILAFFALIIFAIVKIIMAIVKKSRAKSSAKAAARRQMGQNSDAKIAVALEEKPDVKIKDTNDNE